MYNYLYATEGKEAAEEYLKYIEEGLNYRQGKAEADIVGDSLLKAAGYGIRTGVERFGAGIAGMFDDEAKAPTAVAGGVSSASMGLSAGGNAKAQALRDGYTPEQATRYGVLIGASEGALQYLLGGIGKLGGKLTGGVAKKAIQNIDSSLLRIAATGAIKMAGEGTEEYLQEILDPIYRNLLFNENNQIDLTDPEAVYSFLLGALTAGVMDGSEIIREGIAARPSSLPNVNGAIVAADAAQNIQSKQTAMQNAAQETEQYVYTDETTGIPMVGARKNIASEVTPEAIARNKKEVAQMAPVAAMDGTEFPKGSTGIFDQVAEFFQTMGNKVANAILGNVTIDRRGIKDSVGHGLGRNKAIAFKAVPQVIRDGRIIDYQKNWKGRGYDTVVLAAPVTIKSEPYYEGVILIRPQDGQRFYLHEVLAANEKDMPTPFKTGTTQGGTSGGTGMPSLISLLDEIRKVNAPENNIDLIPMEEALLGPAPRGILQQEQGLFKNSISQTAEKGNTAGGIYDLDNAVSEAAQIRPVEGVASNAGDTAKTAQTSVATNDSVVPGALEAVAPQEAAEKLSHSLLRGSESVISEVYADEDGAVSVRIGDRPITMDAREAQAMAAYYDGSVDAVDYVTGFHSVYGLAAQGSTLQQIKGGSSFFGAELTQEQLAGAYNAGHNVYTAQQQAATANAARNAELHARADAERTELELARKRVEALDPASQSFQPGVNRITDGKLSRKQRAQLRVLDAIGKKYGVEIVVDDGLYYDENGEMINSSDANAMFNRETGRIHINLNAVGEAYLAVGMHELVHYVQEYNAEGYSTLETVVLGALEERSEDVNALVRYQMEQFGYSEQLAREEVVANTLPAVLNDEAYVKKLVSMDRTLAERIRDFIADFVSFVNETLRALEGEASWKQVRSIREDTEMLSAIGELFDVALEGVPARRGEASTGGERFSIKYDVNNRPFVVVDEDILDGVPRKEWVKTVKSNLRTKFPNGVTVGENTIYINKTSRKEMTFSKYMQWVLQHDQAAYTDKLRATDNVDEIMRASRNFVDEALLHPRKDDIKQFARGDTLLRVGNNDYTATVIVGTTKSGYMLLYDIINLNPTTIIERNSKKDTATDQRRSEVSRNAVSIDNVPQSGTSVNPSIRENVQKNAKDGGGERFSIRDNMTEAERYEEIKNAELSVATYDADASKLTRAEVARLENATRRDARQYVKTLYEKFGLDEKRYENPSVKIKFEFSYKGFAKSVHEQAARGNEYGSFGEMLACFDKIVENAIPLEIHTDKYTGTKREDADLRRVYVLVSAFEDNGVVPVQLEVKEFIEKDSSLYVAVTLHKVEDAVLATENVSIETPARAVRISTISLRDLFANINPADGEFLKYVPDGFLNAEQQDAKQEALKKEQRKISNLRFSAKDERSASIKQQIAAHQEELNKMSPAATIESGIRPRKNGKPDRTLMRKSLQAFYGSLKYSVERQGFGKVSFDESALSELVHYIKDDAEFAAAKAAPAVVKRGVFVEHHTEHKGRNSVESFTIAAPVVLNGKRGNEAVVVQRTNRNKPHCVRILMPDGSGFDLDTITKADQDRSAAATESGRQQLIESASINSISEADENSNLRFSLKDTSPVDVNELRAGNEKLRRALDLAEDQVKLTAGHKVKEGYVGTLAKRILKEYNSSFDYDTFKANLIKVFEYLSHAKNPNMAEVEEVTIGLMKRVIEKSNTFDAAGYEAYAGVRSYLRETGVSLSEDQKLEAAVLSDTYGAYRASLFGSVKLTNDGIALDSAWQEQSGLRPEARENPVPALTEK